MAFSSGSRAGSKASVLANATGISHFGYFQCNISHEFVFIARTVAAYPAEPAPVHQPRR
jgi:hypothetical protein